MHRRRKSISTCNMLPSTQHQHYHTFNTEFYFEDLPTNSKLTLEEYKEEILYEGKIFQGE